MVKWEFTKGLHDIGAGNYAYLVPDGSWGWSNAGLIEDAGQTLLVDTLFDLNTTREMLDAMHDAVPASKNLGALVNTHANGDHTFGNQLLKGHRIIASQACAEDMNIRPPSIPAQWQREWQTMGLAGKFWYEINGSRFDFQNIELVLPTETFTDRYTMTVGDKEVHLINVGPAHTRGDVIVHVPADKVVYTGDILFNGAHPAIWAGPVRNWIAACDLMLSWDLEVVVPGHGALTDKSGVREFKAYLEYILAESRKCYDAGMHWTEAAEKISLDPFAHFAEDERMYINTYACYRDFGWKEEGQAPDFLRMLELMAHRYYCKKEGCCA